MSRARTISLFVAVALAAAATGASLYLRSRAAAESKAIVEHLYAAPLADLGGATKTLASWKGKVLVINFWATWCAPCRHEMPLLAKLQREYEPRRFRVLYLSLEEPEVVDAFLSAHHFDGIQGRIGAAPAFYDAGRYYPLSYLVGRDGQVVARWSGRPGEAWLSDTIERHL
jgi:thiol-disulfide isomerase/thioredoxin